MELLPATRNSGTNKQRVVIALAGTAWLALLVGGMAMLHSYGTSPGISAKAPETLPAIASLQKADDLPTLVMIAHPRCPCTGASLEELGDLLRANPGVVKASVIFYRPNGEAPEWAHRELWQTAAALPGVTVSTVEEKDLPFGQTTSGTVLFYNVAGQLVFQGGLTSARGEYGPSLGQDTLRALLLGQPAPSSETPVFGCPLSPKAPLAQVSLPQ